MKRAPAQNSAAAPRPIAWRAEAKDLLLVAGVALAVRLVALFLNARNNPAFDYLIMDSGHIDRWARALAAGDGAGGVYFRGPLYPYVLSFLYRLGGGVTAAVFLNHLFGAATCGLIYLFAREYVARRVALVAGLVAALYWPFIYFEGEILIEPFFVLLVTLSLWRLARAAASPGPVPAAIAGACLGLAALARPNILILLPVLPLVFAAGARAPLTRAGAWLRPTAVTLGVCVALLVPATVHNWRTAGTFVPVAWSGGLNFYIGNNENSDGRSASIPGAKTPWMGGEDEALAIAGEQAGRALTPAEASRFYSAQAWGWIAANPGEAVKLGLAKLHMFWEGPERSNEKYIYFFWDRFGLGRVPMPGYWLISPLALAAMIRLWPRRREWALPYLFVLAYMAGVVAFFVVARLRLPVVPVLIVFAAWALADLFSAARARAWAPFAATAACFAACFLVVNISYPPFLQKRASHLGISYYTLAGAHVEKGNPDRAIVELEAARRAFEAAPSKVYAMIAQDTYFKLGTLWYERGNCDQAADALGQLRPVDPRAAEARMMFATCCEKTGRFVEAGRAYELILRTDPRNRPAIEGLVRCLEEVGEYEDAAEARKMLEGL